MYILFWITGYRDSWWKLGEKNDQIIYRKVYICLLVDYYDICEANKCNCQIQYWCGDSSFDFNSFVFKLQEFDNIEPHEAN
jgi:hypothetical protein